MGADLLARADGLRAARTPFVLATVVRAERPTSAKAGDRAIVLGDGTMEGFVGGACAESTVRAEGLRLLDEGANTLLRITPDPTDSGGPDVDGLRVVGNPCLSGGTLDIFLEAVLPPTLVHVFGDAPIARALAIVAGASGYAVAVATDPDTAIEPDTAAVVVASHGRHEEPVLTAALRAGVPYVGLVASPKRGRAVVAGLDPAGADRVRTPAGLDLGARTPLEVAVSILAELIQVRAQARPDVAGLVPHRPGLRSEGSEATGATREGGAEGHQARASGASANIADPVCAMTVAAVPASLHLEHAGRTWYFCGPGCRQAFADDPGRYGG
jgi:xanthine dehydrogenase accessory factor